MKKLKPIVKSEMSEDKLLLLCKIFYPENKWGSKKWYKYDINNGRKRYEPDVHSDDKKLIFEYEGPKHYGDVWKIQKDNERKKWFQQKGYNFHRWPYYCQLTKDVAKYFFKDAFTEKKYIRALKDIYDSDEEKNILAPGFHVTPHIPANFSHAGSNRFFEELDALPYSLKIQVINSLKLYIKAYDSHLVIPDTQDYNSLLKTNCPSKYLNYFYRRKNDGSLFLV